MNNTLKYIVGILIGGITLVCIFLALTRAARQRENRVFSRIAIENDSPQGQRFLENEELIARVEKMTGGILGRKVKDIDLNLLEKDLDKTSCILKSQVYADKEGTLYIHLSERKPFVRLQTTGGGFYADRDGKIFPLQARYSAWVPVIEGKLPVDNWYALGKPEQEWMDGMIRLVSAFQDNPKWKNRCTQYHITKDGLIVISLDGYAERFILGDYHQIENKQRKIEQYISLIRPQQAEGKNYKTVNVRFKGQIICQ
ncbi:MAG: hypothetical protein J6T35_00585 [Bacteroidales bacterium]|nr:hypothetical protein [Bacteroidales bacterium]